MKRVDVRFYAGLNDFLPLWRRKRPTTCDFDVSGSVKDMIEALGVPHTEVDLILANGESVDFSYRVQDGDKISVYPVFESIDISSLVRLRPVPLREVRFIADVHLGRLAASADGGLRYVVSERLSRRGTGQNFLRRKANTPDEGPRAPEAKRCHSRLLRAGDESSRAAR